MSESKKDLTGLFELSEELRESGQEPPLPEGLVFEETPIEKIDDFESLDSYAQAHPSVQAEAIDAGLMDPGVAPTEPHDPIESAEVEVSLGFISPTETTEPQFQHEPEQQTETQPVSLTQKIPTAVHASVPAAFPFTLLIEGPLTAREKEKLLDIIHRENMGIREIDLEPQFQCEKILLPRISEFTGVYIVQQLRETRAKIRFGPSEEIFAAQGTTEDTQPFWNPTSVDQLDIPDRTEPQHPADTIPVTTERTLPGLDRYVAIDTLTASATLQTFAVEAETTSEYQDLVTALQREIKYKARRRGAAAVIHFRIQLTPLTSPSRYRITVMGLAIRGR